MKRQIKVREACLRKLEKKKIPQKIVNLDRPIAPVKKMGRSRIALMQLLIGSTQAKYILIIKITRKLKKKRSLQ